MTATEPRYPQVRVKLSGTDGNAFSLMGRCSAEAKRAGLTKDQIAEFTTEAMSGDYNHLLRTCAKFFAVR